MEINLFAKVRKIKFGFYQQYLGFILFLTILTTGFWLMIFLIGFVIPYWLSGNLIEWFKERKKAKQSE
jgi:hypothetical protein